MAFTTSVVAVEDTATLLIAAGRSRKKLVVQQNDSVTVAIGGAGVTFADGLVLAGNPDPQTSPESRATLAFGDNDDAIYAIADTDDTGSVRLLIEV